MGLFDKGCPLEKNHLKMFGIPAPTKWKKEDCQECQYLEGEKCTGKEALAKQKHSLKRGHPALVKKSSMHLPAAERRKAEAAAVKKAGFSGEEEKGYWLVSATYDTLWETASDMQKQDILESLFQLKVNLESGASPAQAQIKVAEWQKKRDDFRRQA